jgi:hypothetical protein
MKLVKLIRTCIASPSQWDGELDDGRLVYIRFRHGYCSVCVGDVGGDIWSAVRGEEVTGFNWGEHSMAGDMSNDELIKELTDRGWDVACQAVGLWEIRRRV